MQAYRLSYFTLLVPTWILPGCSISEAADSRPNVLLVVADDLGCTDLGSKAVK